MIGPEIIIIGAIAGVIFLMIFGGIIITISYFS